MQKLINIRSLIGFTSLASIVLVALNLRIPILFVGAYLFFCIASFSFYAFDKFAAKCGWRRIPERNLLIADLLGGWAGGLIAQGIFRHKTKKRSFLMRFYASIAINLVSMAYIAEPLNTMQ